MFNFLKQKDKQLHFKYGFVISVVISIVASFLFPVVIAGMMGIVITTIVGAGKEIYDSFGNGQVEFMDFIATVLGGLFGILLFSGIVWFL